MMERALIICLFLTSLFGMVNHANAQSLCEEGRGYINNPAPGYNVSSNMGIRNLDDVLPPGTRYSRNHPGTDYSAACGTRIPGPPPGCALSGSTSVQGNLNARQVRPLPITTNMVTALLHTAQDAPSREGPIYVMKML